MFDPQKIKLDFPILGRSFGSAPSSQAGRQDDNRELVYLDNSATSQKPIQVINAISNYYKLDNANVHRGIHYLSDQATKAWERSREVVAKFFGAQNEELIVTRNATEAINGVAYGWADHHLSKGDVILTTMMEHHANIVPWQQVCLRTGASLEFVKVTNEGRLDLEDFEKRVNNKEQRVKLVTFAHVSNTLGTVNPVLDIVRLVKKYQPEAKILVDGAQSAPHFKINFDQMDVDFFAFSGHKMLGPMGVGGLLVRHSLLASGEVHPWFFGGGMIASVLPEKTEFNPDLSELFTPGTPDVASLVGLATACEYLNNLGMENIENHDRELVMYALERLGELKDIEVVGPKEVLQLSGSSHIARGVQDDTNDINSLSFVSDKNGDQKIDRLGSVAFVHKLAHAHDVAQIFDSVGVAVRSGHHCCMPLHKAFGWQATVRASFQVYNSKQDVDQLLVGLEKVRKVFG